MSKRKYNELRSSEMFEFDLTTGKRRRTEFKKGCKVPSLVPYKDLMKFISEQEIGTLHNIPQARADSEIEKESEDVNQELLPLVPSHYSTLSAKTNTIHPGVILMNIVFVELLSIVRVNVGVVTVDCQKKLPLVLLLET